MTAPGEGPGPDAYAPPPILRPPVLRPPTQPGAPPAPREAPPHFGIPPQPSSPPHVGIPPQPGSPPRFGIPPQPGGPSDRPGVDLGPAPDVDPVAVPGRPAIRSRRTAALAGTALAIVVVAVAAVVAVPALASHGARAYWASTRFDLPAQLLDLPRRSASGGALHLGTASDPVAASPGLADLPIGARSAVYGTVAGEAIVVIAYRGPVPLSDDAQRSVWAAAEHAVTRSQLGEPALVERHSPGYQGRFACGIVTDGALCLGTDPAGSVLLAATGVPGGVDTVAALRALVERRTG